MARRALAGLIPLLIAAATSGCGGGGGGGDGGNTIVLPAQFDRTGFVSSITGAAQASVVEGHETGDGGSNDVIRGCVAINLAGVPAGATVESAILRLSVSSLIGNPFPGLGTLNLDHVDLGPSLDAADFSGGTLTATIATIPPVAQNSFPTIDVTAAVQADLAAGRASSCFRLWFSAAPSPNGQADLVSFNCRLADADRQPQILLSYE
jgi:hypothetical protein